jgi:hypothetical protein
MSRLRGFNIIVALFFHPTIARARVDNRRVRRGEDEI